MSVGISLEFDTVSKGRKLSLLFLLRFFSVLMKLKYTPSKTARIKMIRLICWIGYYWRR